MAVANSPLVKTAIAGEDANWGRIVMAVGKAGEPADRDLHLGRRRRHLDGAGRRRGGGYDETPVVAHMKGREIEIAVDLGLGTRAGHGWTCDLTHGYIDINGILSLLSHTADAAVSAFEPLSHRAADAAGRSSRRTRPSCTG